MKISETKRSINNNEEEVSVKDLPAFYELEKKVTKIVANASWMELYGRDWVIHVGAMCAAPVGLLLMASGRLSAMALGMVLYGVCHSILANKAGHLASHGALCASPRLNRAWTWFFVEVVGNFSQRLGIDIHIRMHHPHTNIIGLGDSSTWRLPMLPRFIYFFLAPLFIPAITPLVAVAGLWGQWVAMAKFLASASAGFSLCLWPLVAAGGYSVAGAVVLIFSARGVCGIPYLHINIFQHIGLPMYDQGSRPARIYQMATGVLNLDRHPLLDWPFGHSLIDCHVEHHLFPRLSDHMCLRVKPVVRQFLESHGLPYNQRSYSERLAFFFRNYSRLMVDAPPITHFVGLP